jgi:hypothetical protein
MNVFVFLVIAGLLILELAFLYKIWEMTNNVEEIKSYIAINQAQMTELNKKLKKLIEKL